MISIEAFLLTWAVFIAIGAFITKNHSAFAPKDAPDTLEHRWEKVFGYSFILVCIVTALTSIS